MAGSVAVPSAAGDAGFTQIGGCRLIQRLDTGTAHDARAVYLAQQPRLGNRLVVVKLTPLHAEAGGEDQARDLQDALLRHARALGQLTHPNILPLYDAGVTHGLFYLVTQYVPDGSLAAALGGTAPRGRLALPARPGFVVDLIAQVAAALHYLHAHGLVHGAVGPASVLLHAQPDGCWRALLADAGLPSATRDAAASSSQGAAPTPADDQAALAALAYLLLAGHAPAALDAPNTLNTSDTPNTPDTAAGPATSGATPADYAAELRAANPAVPAAAAEAIARALAPDPAARFPSVAAFAHEFTLALDSETSPAGQDAWAAPSTPASVGAFAERPLPLPVPAQRWLEPERGGPQMLPLNPARPARRSRRRRDHAAAGPAASGTPPERRHTWRRAGLWLVGLALLLAALVLAIRLPNAGGGPLTAIGQPGGANQVNQGGGQQVGVAGGQLTLAGGTATPSTTIAAAAPPATPMGQGDRATLIAPLAAITAAPGQPFAASFSMLNSGASTWSAAGGYDLICDRARHPDASCPAGTWIGFGPQVIAPGQQATFTLDLIAPVTPGTYVLWWNLAHAGHIFASPDVVLRLVVPLPPQPTATPTLTPSATPATTPSTTPSVTPSVTPDPSPTASPSASPSASPTTTLAPMLSPIPTPLTTLPPLG